ncbi:hypothetical protein M3Y94_00316600 [Aphelenchoides besseyi]|nr:hypothetical protein M3Y94_00316600 [Aphelenchoides besseyi]KAI6235683.1 hypothetical protein M3Y95_00077600 [Aphelenchoides besseyi]
MSIIIATNYVSQVFAISIFVYVTIVLLIYLFLKSLKPELFSNTSDNEIEGLEFGQTELIDCSFVYNVCPCQSVSFRSCLRKLNPTSNCQLKSLANCEFMRPAVQGNTPYRVDFICCRI